MSHKHKNTSCKKYFHAIIMLLLTMFPLLLKANEPQSTPDSKFAITCPPYLTGMGQHSVIVSWILIRSVKVGSNLVRKASLIIKPKTF